MRLLLIPFLCYTFSHAAEGGFPLLIKGPFEDALYAVTEEYDGQIAAAGISEQFASSDGDSETYYSAFDYLEDQRASGARLRIVRLDGTGTLTRDLSLALPRLDRVVALDKIPGDGYTIGGYRRDGALFLARIGSDGVRRYAIEFGTSGRDTLNRLLPLRDGGYLAVAASMTVRGGGLFEQGLGGTDLYLVRFSPEGQKLWGKKYGTPEDDEAAAAVEAEDGTIVVLGTSRSKAGTQVSLMRIDGNGEKLWQREYGADRGCRAYDLAASRGALIASLGCGSGEDARLLTFDLQQQRFDERNVTMPGKAVINRLKAAADGRLVGVGFHIDPANGHTDALAVGFAPTGEMAWKRRFSGPESDRFHDLVLLRNGDIVAVGEQSAPGRNERDMWIVRLHPDGSTASGAVAEGNLYERLKEQFADELAKGSITLTRDLRIVLNHPSLLFKAGVYTLTPVQEGFIDRFGTRLLEVLKPFKMEIAGLRVNGHTSSEWLGADAEARYLNNMQLSQRRAFSVVSYLYKDPENVAYRPWLAQLLSGDGYAYAKRIMNPDEDRTASRRVAFEIFLR